MLIEKGYREVWPLLGGLDGWIELAYPTEPVAPHLPVMSSVPEAEPSS